ncbi:hypothetical protein [Streptomyces sp. NPDC002671]
MTNTTNSPLRAVFYTRISHDPTGKAEGVTRQEEACRKLAADLGWRVVAVKTDDDLTAIGKRGQRAQRTSRLRGSARHAVRPRGRRRPRLAHRPPIPAGT